MTQHRLIKSSTNDLIERGNRNRISPHIDDRSIELKSTPELFLVLESITITGKDKKDKFNIQKVREFIKAACKRTDISPVTEQLNWANLFKQREKSTGSILSQERVRHIKNIIETYIKLEEIDTVCYGIAKSLDEYLTLHEFDPENSIIGLLCKPSILGSFRTLSRTILDAYTTFGDEIWKFGTLNNDKNLFSISFSKIEIYTKLKDILNENYSDTERVRRTSIFIDFCSAIDQFSSFWTNELKFGDILIIAGDSYIIDKYPELPPSPQKEIQEFRFARFVKYDKETRLVYIFKNYDEKQLSTVAIHQCMPFPSAWTCNFGSKKSLDRLLNNRANTLFSRLVSYLKYQLDGLFLKKNIDTNLMERLIVYNIEVSDSKRIKYLSTQIQELQIDFPKQFITSVSQIISICIERFENSDEINQMFIPTKDINCSALRAISIEELIRIRLSKFIEYCEQALDYLENQKMLVVNGTKKQEITSWWLKVIEKKVRAFLTNAKYDFTAVRYDYIESPPENLKSVRSNLEIIQKILDKNIDVYNLKGLLNDITSIVYPKIDLFMKNAQTALCDKLSIPFDEFTVEIGLEKLKEYNIKPNTNTTNNNNINNSIDNNDKELSYDNNDDNNNNYYSENCVVKEWMEALLKDIEYLETIKRLEISQPTKGKGDLNVVPISGLVLNSFIRLETELKTVLEVWDPSWVIKKTKQDVENEVLKINENRASIIMASPSETIRGNSCSMFLASEELISSHAYSMDEKDDNESTNFEGNINKSQTTISMMDKEEDLPDNIISVNSSDIIEENIKREIPDIDYIPDGSEEKVLMISMDDILSNLTQMEALSKKGFTSRSYSEERNTTKKFTKKPSKGLLSRLFK